MFMLKKYGSELDAGWVHPRVGLVHKISAFYGFSLVKSVLVRNFVQSGSKKS